MKRRLILLFIAFGLSAAGCVHVEHHKEREPARLWCQDHPNECRGWCQDHPDQCREHSWCEDHPGDCEHWCTDHPGRCAP